MGDIFCTFLILLDSIFDLLSRFFLKFTEPNYISPVEIQLDGMQFWAICGVTTFAVQLLMLKLILSNEDKYNTIPSPTTMIQIPSHQPTRAVLNQKDNCSSSIGHAYSLILISINY